MSDIQWCTNHVASAYLDEELNFYYTYTPQYSEMPDVMIIRQICCEMDPLKDLTTSLSCNILCDATNQTIGNILFPYKVTPTDDEYVALSFVSNPQTFVQMFKPLAGSIQFMFIPTVVNSLGGCSFNVSITFDLIKYKENKHLK